LPCDSNTARITHSKLWAKLILIAAATLEGSSILRQMTILVASSLVVVLMACGTAMMLSRRSFLGKDLPSTTPNLLEDSAPAHTSRIVTVISI
jgi:hypothetical protein